MYFTATFPYFMLFVLFIRGVTLPGAGEGLKYYLKPDFTRLSDPDVRVHSDYQMFIFKCLVVEWTKSQTQHTVRPSSESHSVKDGVRTSSPSALKVINNQNIICLSSFLNTTLSVGFLSALTGWIQSPVILSYAPLPLHFLCLDFYFRSQDIALTRKATQRWSSVRHIHLPHKGM